MASSAPQYTCEIVIHRAANVPIADLNTLSSDPYIRATVSPRVPQPVAATGPPPQSPAPEAQYISFRTITARKTLDPVFNARWLVSGIPASGFVLTLQLNDEDPGNHDDRLGKAVIRFPDPNLGDSSGQSLKEGWDSGEREYKMHKRHGSLRARLGTYIAKTLTRGRVGHRVRVFVSVRVLGPAPRLEGEDSERIYTLGPRLYIRPYGLSWLIDMSTIFRCVRTALLAACNPPDVCQGLQSQPFAAYRTHSLCSTAPICRICSFRQGNVP